MRKVHPHRTDSSEQESTAEGKGSFSAKVLSIPDSHQSVNSTNAERMLYSAIALSIQSALEDMEKETRQKLGSAYPELPRVVTTGEWKQLVGKQARDSSENKEENS